MDFEQQLHSFAPEFMQAAARLAAQDRKMLITMHRFLDGDAFGSAVALALILRRLGVDSTVLCVPFIPDKLRFLASMNGVDVVEPHALGAEDTRQLEGEEGGRLVRDFFSKILHRYGGLAVLDAAGRARVPEEAWAVGEEFAYKINIDHHSGYLLHHDRGRVLNLVGSHASTCEVLFHLLPALGMDLDPEIAVPLYTGVIADLRKNEVSRDSSRYPQDAIRQLDRQASKSGFGLRELVKHVFALDPWEKHLLAMTLEGKRSFDNVAYVHFDETMIHGAKQATDSLDNLRMPFHEFHIRLRKRIKRLGASFQVVVIFDHLLGKVSLHGFRHGSAADLARISRQLGGGGGHRNRAGFSFAAAREKLLESGRLTPDKDHHAAMEELAALIDSHLES